mgnify:CR=1 FL=1
MVDADERTCDVCGKLEGKRFPINGKMPVPAHPRCRCCIIPVVDEEKDVEELSEGSYNGFTACFDDNVNFNKNKDVKEAIKNPTANFVRIFEPTNLAEFEEVYFGVDIEKTPKIKGYFDIKAHGDFQSIKLFNTPINAETLAKILTRRKDYKNGTPIRMLSCNTGKNETGVCFAQDLANMLETEVIAPDFTLFVDSSGRLYRGRGIPIGKEDFKRFTPQGKEN